MKQIIASVVSLAALAGIASTALADDSAAATVLVGRSIGFSCVHINGTSSPGISDTATFEGKKVRFVGITWETTKPPGPGAVEFHALGVLTGEQIVDGVPVQVKIPIRHYLTSLSRHGQVTESAVVPASTPSAAVTSAIQVFAKAFPDSDTDVFDIFGDGWLGGDDYEIETPFSPAGVCADENASVRARFHFTRP